jgi:apolipoprotein N-acyltransferase
VSLGFLAWIAFIPLYFAIAGARLRRVFWLTWMQQLAFLICTLYWLWIPLHIDGNKSIAISAGMIIFVSSAEAFFAAVSVLGAEVVSRRLRVSRLISYPIAWTALEWVRSFFPIGFPWNPLGGAVFREIPVIQIAEFVGVFGLSALIIFVNVALWELISSAIAGRRNSRTAAALALVTAAVFGFGMLRISELERMPAAGHLKVAMIQGNIPQSDKWDPSKLAPTFKIYSDATEAAARLRPDLIIWPETASDFVFQPVNAYPWALRADAPYWTRLTGLAARIGVPILFGAPALDIGRSLKSRNRAYMLGADGRVRGYYDKIELVPVGEYVPILLKRFVKRMVDAPTDFFPGDQQTIFDLGAARIGVLICYESIFPYLSQRAVHAGANVLVNITNDAWYGRSSAPYQLLAMTVMRAVENRTPIVRVGNTGISAIITPVGRIQDATQLFTRTTEIETVEWKNVIAFYSQAGDAFAWLCSVLLSLGLLAAAIVPRRFE